MCGRVWTFVTTLLDIANKDEAGKCLKMLAIVLALAGLLAALRAAHLWWKAGTAPVLPETSASISDVPELYTMT
jgi:hypothetical protein